MGFPRVDRIGVERDSPSVVAKRDFAFLKETARILLRSNFPAELGPHFLLAVAEDVANDIH
jgi:hypothetical protein